MIQLSTIVQEMTGLLSTQDTIYSTFTTSCVHYGQLILSCNELCGFGLPLNDFDQYEYLHLLLKKFLVPIINQPIQHAAQNWIDYL